MATDIMVADQQQTESSSLNSSSTTATTTTTTTSDLNNNTTNNSNVNENNVATNGGGNDATSGEWAVVYNQKEKHRLKQTKQQQSQNCKSSSTTTNDKQQKETTTTELKKSQSHQLNLKSSEIGNEQQQSKQNANPWAKLAQQQQHNNDESQPTQTKKDHQLNTSSTSQSSSSSFNPNTSTSSSSSIQPSNNTTTTTTTNNSSNLDFMDWPSLSDVNCSINNNSSQTNKRNNVGITQSKSSIELNDIRNKKTTMNSRKFKSQSSFNENDEVSGDGDDDGIYEDDEYDNDNSNHNNNNTKSSINGETNETTTSTSSSTSGSGGSNNCSSDESKENNTSNNNKQQQQQQQTKQQIKKKQKWKPLIIEAGKRERKSYRPTHPPSHISPSTTKTNNNKDRVKSVDRSISSNYINGTTTDATTASYNTSTTTPTRNDYYYNNQQYSTTTTHIPHSSTTYSGFYKYNTKKYPKSESTRSFRHYASTTTTTTATNSNYKMSTSRSDNIHDHYKDNYMYNDDTTQIILKDIVDSHCNIAATAYSTTPTPAVIPPTQPYILVDYNNQFEILKELIKNQIEYYFSDENLNGDIYLRRKMDANGYIEIALISAFNRVKSLTQDQQLILDAIQSSDQLEISEDYLRIRRRNDPLKWPLPSLLQTLNPDVPEFVPKFMLQQKSNNDQESVHINAELDRLLSTTSEPENELLIGNKQQQKQNDNNYNRFTAAAAATSANLSSLSLH